MNWKLDELDSAEQEVEEEEEAVEKRTTGQREYETAEQEEAEENKEEAKHLLREQRRRLSPLSKERIAELVHIAAERVPIPPPHSTSDSTETEKTSLSHSRKRHSVSDSPSPKRTRGGPKPILAETPELKGVRIQTFAQLSDLIETNYPKMKERSDFDKLMSNAERYYRFLELVDGAPALTRKEVYAIAEQLQITKGVACYLAFQPNQPRIFEILKDAISRFEFEERKRIFREMLGELACWEDVRQRIVGTPKEKYLSFSTSRQLIKEVVNFFRLLDEKEQSGTIKGIAARTKINTYQIDKFLQGELPQLIRLALAPSVEVFEAAPELLRRFADYFAQYVSPSSPRTHQRERMTSTTGTTTSAATATAAAAAQTITSDSEKRERLILSPGLYARLAEIAQIYRTTRTVTEPREQSGRPIIITKDHPEERATQDGRIEAGE
ncbi:MAG: hypothetical protein ACTSYL_02285, partial [Candidatus Thorarchaeota archaeon]